MNFFFLMRDYFIRRLLLIPPVLVGISLMVFALTRMAPGGPIEQAMMQMQQETPEQQKYVAMVLMITATEI